MEPGRPFRRGQLVMRRRDDAVLEVVAFDRRGTRVLLSDGGWLPVAEVEDPLRESLRRDLLPRPASGRRAAARGSRLAALGWWVALVEAAALLTLALV